MTRPERGGTLRAERCVVNEYREKVQRLALERTGEPFFNASEDHAAIIVENMFRSAQKEVCIFTRNLAPRIYGRDASVQWAEIFLSDDSEHSLRVILREGDLLTLETNPLYRAVKGARNVSFAALDNAVHDVVESSFMVADADSYRFEPDKTKCEAVAAFNSSHAKTLQGIFDRMWNVSKPVNLDKLETLSPSLVN